MEPKTIQVGRELKCKSHVRVLDGYDYWSYSLPASARNLNKNKEKVSFSYKYFEDLEKKTTTLPQNASRYKQY